MTRPGEAWLMERRLRMVHRKRQASDGSWYCELCADHGDIQWPCETIRVMELAQKEARS
jgi:hypothetical protein